MTKMNFLCQYQWYLAILILIICVYDCSSIRARSAFRSSSSRFSYRAPSYRSSFRTSSYNMAPGVMYRKGGLGMDKKKLLLAAGSVYIAYKLRPNFHFGGRYRYNDDFAICRGNLTGLDERNMTVRYQYFVCPKDYNYIIRWDDKKYCCGPAEMQYCCDEEQFYRQYGVLATGASVAVIAVVCVLAILFLCSCFGLILYCKFRSRRGPHQPQPVPSQDPLAFKSNDGAAPAYPMQQANQPADYNYSVAPYPPAMPAMTGEAPPYPTYQPPLPQAGGAPPPNWPPPAYPGRE